jgi:hypothetical protein
VHDTFDSQDLIVLSAYRSIQDEASVANVAVVVAPWRCNVPKEESKRSMFLSASLSSYLLAGKVCMGAATYDVASRTKVKLVSASGLQVRQLCFRSRRTIFTLRLTASPFLASWIVSILWPR